MLLIRIEDAENCTEFDIRLACGHWYHFGNAEGGAFIVNEAAETPLWCRACGDHRQLHLDVQAQAW